MNDSRSLAILIGAAALVGALFAPWYALDLSGSARDAIGEQTGQLPAALAEFARGLLAVLPERIVVDGWQAFERTDIVLLACALAAAFASLIGRLDVAGLAGAAAVGATLLAMIDKPGPGQGIVQLQWGPWVALVAAVVIVAAARVRPSEQAAPAPADRQAAPLAAPASAGAERPRSVAPPS